MATTRESNRAAKKANELAVSANLVARRAWKTSLWLGIMSCLLALLAATFTGWQAREAQRSNENQARRDERAMAENVYVDAIEIPEDLNVEPVADGFVKRWGPNAVVNLNRLPMVEVWLEGSPTSSSNVMYFRVGTIGSCAAVFAPSEFADRFTVHFRDMNGRYWKRRAYQPLESDRQRGIPEGKQQMVGGTRSEPQSDCLARSEPNFVG